MTHAYSQSTIVLANPGWHGEREVEAGNISLGWRANGSARASFQLSARDAHLIGFTALLGRWVWCDSPVGAWAGFVQDTPTEVGGGVIELACVDLSALMDHTITPRTYRQISSAPGALMERAIRDSGVDTGSWFSTITVDEEGSPVTVEWRGESTMRVVASLASNNGGMWGVTIDESRALAFTYVSTATDKRGSILLVEGHNVLDGSIRPSIALLVNDILGIANDRDWQRAAGARVYDEDSIRLYDRRRAVRRYEGHTRRSSLEAVARAELAGSALPAGPVSLELSERNPICKELRHSQLVTLWSATQNRIYDLTIVGIAHEPSRGTVTVVGTAEETS